MKCYQMRLINEVYKRYFEGEKYMLNVQACPRKQLPDKIGDKGIICFGAGRGLTTFLRDNRNIYDKVRGFWHDCGDHVHPLMYFCY